MAHFVDVLTVGDLPPGSCRTVDAGSRQIAIANLEGEIHALDNTCPHAGGPLGEGTIEGQDLICPWHGWRFDLTSGACRFNASLTQKRYPVEIQGESIRVLID